MTIRSWRQPAARTLWPGALLLLCGACAPPDNDYFPTTPGYEWVYDISKTVLHSNEPVQQKSIVRNLKAQTIGTQRYYPKIYANGEKRYFARTSEGMVYYSPAAPDPTLVLGYPLQPGTRWRAPSRLYLFELPEKPGQGRARAQQPLMLDYTIIGMEDVALALAGRFTDCLRVEAVGFLDLPERLELGIRSIKVEQTQWFAPGVGLVKMTRKEYAPPDLYPSSYTQTLATFTRH